MTMIKKTRASVKWITVAIIVFVTTEFGYVFYNEKRLAKLEEQLASFFFFKQKTAYEMLM